MLRIAGAATAGEDARSEERESSAGAMDVVRGIGSGTYCFGAISERERAADFKRRMDAVRLDLKEDERGWVLGVVGVRGRLSEELCESAVGGLDGCGSAGGDSGWSEALTESW